MIAHFYNMTSDSNKLDKDITLMGSASITLKDDTEMVNPTIIISKIINYDFNYVYLADFGRYYFVANRTYSQQRYYITLEVDTLMTYKAHIKDLEVIANRSSSNFNLYQTDEKVPQLAYNVIATQRFKNGFGGQSFILATTSGGTTPTEESEVIENG